MLEKNTTVLMEKGMENKVGYIDLKDALYTLDEYLVKGKIFYNPYQNLEKFDGRRRFAVAIGELKPKGLRRPYITQFLVIYPKVKHDVFISHLSEQDNNNILKHLKDVAQERGLHLVEGEFTDTLFGDNTYHFFKLDKVKKPLSERLLERIRGN